MARKLLQTAALLAVFTAAGCTQFNYTGYDVALRSVPDQPIPPPLRSQVHVFVLNGIDPLEDGPMLTLRDELNKAGFAKVYYAQRADVEWYYREMCRVVHDQPAARLLLVGYGATARPARELACRVRGEKLPLDTLVLLDPVGFGSVPLDDADTGRMVVIRSHHWKAGRDLPAAEVVEVPGVGHLSLPSHPGTVEAIARLMADSATRVQLGPPDALPHLPLTDRPQPAPRPSFPVSVVPTP